MSFVDALHAFLEPHYSVRYCLGRDPYPKRWVLMTLDILGDADAGLFASAA